MEVLRAVVWLKVSIKVLRFVFRRMEFQLVKSLPSSCEIPSVHGAAPEGDLEVVQHPRALHHGAVPAPVAEQSRADVGRVRRERFSTAGGCQGPNACRERAAFSDSSPEGSQGGRRISGVISFLLLLLK